jgi:hypothetical protein
MTSCLSPEYNLELFCFRLVAQEGHALDVMSALDAVTRESAAARRQHRHRTREQNFRAGSKGRLYCDDLKALVSLLVNGTTPDSIRDGFLKDVRPLVMHLLERWEIGDLRKIFL